MPSITSRTCAPTGAAIRPDGACQSAEVEQSQRLVAAQVVEFAQMRIGDSGARIAHERAALSSAELAERMTQMEMTFRLMG